MKLLYIVGSIVVIGLFILGLSSLAQPQIDYQLKFQEHLTKSFSLPEVVQTWKDGCKEELGIDFDHLLVTYEPKGVTPYDNENKLVTALCVVTIKIYGYKDGEKVHLLLSRQIAGLINAETGAILDTRILSQTRPVVKLGWDGIDV